MKKIVLLVLVLGCGDKETSNEENSTPTPFVLCDYLEEHSEDYGEEMAFEVYCQNIAECEESTRVAVSQSLLIDAQAACEEADELNTWEYLEGECPQETGDSLGAVRCWSVD